MKIGIFGGSFNPPHKMHESIAKELLKKNIVDKIIFVPTSNYYKKEGLISDKNRVDMLLILKRKYKNIEVSKYELNRLTYTYETLAYFKEQYPNDEIYFICGTDNLKVIDTWKEYEKILNDYKLIVILREDDIDEILKKYDKYRKNINVVDIKNNFLSSTSIRKSIKEKDYNKIKDYLDIDVLQYIIDKKLYL